MTARLDPAVVCRSLKASCGNCVPWKHPDFLTVLLQVKDDKSGKWSLAAKTLLGLPDVDSCTAGVYSEIVTIVKDPKTLPRVLEASLRALVFISGLGSDLNADITEAVSSLAHRVDLSPSLASLVCRVLNDFYDHIPLVAHAVVAILLRFSEVDVVQSATATLETISDLADSTEIDAVIASGALTACLHAMRDYMGNIEIVTSCVHVFESLDVLGNCKLYSSLKACGFYLLLADAVHRYPKGTRMLTGALYLLDGFLQKNMMPSQDLVADMAVVLGNHLRSKWESIVSLACKFMHVAAAAHLETMIRLGVMRQVVAAMYELLGSPEDLHHVAACFDVLTADLARCNFALLQADAIPAIVYLMKIKVSVACSESFASLPTFMRALARMAAVNPSIAVERGALEAAVALITRHGESNPDVAEGALNVLEALSRWPGVCGFIIASGGVAAAGIVLKVRESTLETVQRFLFNVLTGFPDHE